MSSAAPRILTVLRATLIEVVNIAPPLPLLGLLVGKTLSKTWTPLGFRMEPT